MKKLDELKASYMLWHDEENNDYILGVNCGTVVGYELRIKLSDKETAEYLQRRSAKTLAEKIQNNPQSFFDRNIQS